MNEYAFLMIDFNTPSIIKSIQNTLNEEDLVPTTYCPTGIEEETHVTLCPCLDNNTDLEELKKYLQPIENYAVRLKNISIFSNDEYDVLKCDVESKAMVDTHNKIGEDFKYNTEFNDYKPHMTIAYMKKGTADKYVCNFDNEMIIVKPNNFSYSYSEDGEDKYIKFN